MSLPVQRFWAAAGKGLKRKTVTGDLYAIIKVIMPPETNAEANQLWRKLAECNAFDPRMEWRKRT